MWLLSARRIREIEETEQSRFARRVVIPAALLLGSLLILLAQAVKNDGRDEAQALADQRAIEACRASGGGTIYAGQKNDLSPVCDETGAGACFPN